MPIFFRSTNPVAYRKSAHKLHQFKIEGLFLRWARRPVHNDSCYCSSSVVVRRKNRRQIVSGRPRNNTALNGQKTGQG